MNRVHWHGVKRDRSSQIAERAFQTYYGVLLVLFLAMILGLFVTAGKSLTEFSISAHHQQSANGEPEP